MVEPDLTMDDAEIAEHREAVSKQTGVDVEKLWAQAPEFKLNSR